MTSRASIVFRSERRLGKVMRSFDVAVSATIAQDMVTFQRHYQGSTIDDDLPARYHFKPFKFKKPPPYGFCEVYLAPNGQYRGVLMFPPRRAEVWWVYAFKKQRPIDRPKIAIARARADELWELLQRS